MTRPTPPSTDRSLATETRLIRRGVGWNAVGTSVSKGAGILAKLVLARLLLPEHFGFVSMVVVFTSVTRIVADLGFRLSLIQRKSDGHSKRLYDSAFWLLLAAALVMIGVMALLGVPLLTWFYGEPRLGGVALAMSSIVIFQNLQVVPEARLARTMRFKQIAIADIVGMLVGGLGAVLLALAGAGVWSLVAQTLLAAAVTSFVNFACAGWRPRLRIDFGLLAQIGAFSRFIVGSRVLISLQQNLDYLLIGKLIGAHALGIYSIAFLLTETLRSQAYWLVSKAVFPFYSRAAGRSADIRAVYLGTVRYLALAIVPVSLVLILFAPDFVPLLFTAKWLAAVVPIQLLALVSMVVASAGTPGEVLRGIGRPDVDFRINLGVALLVAVPGLWLGIRWLGLPGAALAVLAHSLVSRIAYLLALRRLIGLGTADVGRALVPAIAGGLLMVLVRLLLQPVPWLVAAVAATAAYVAATLPLLLPQLRTMLRKPSTVHRSEGQQPVQPLRRAA
ncbi:lipopolysaccharide biosynthesis protein [Sphingomonas ginkgonis]|uniref:Lipopolysaccharide biosynthesis protein n=1 Tax=Sphingomonas ginkgonis TaxID=2315330 RepID=A0A3R9X8R5_9SPHN|nr:lipopolysaccharide biosynthesis protein [Sphingomonas ginkgonis]